jgi:hypothetical protein
MNDLVAFEYDRSFVIDALRQGDLDYLETVSEAAEADLFRHFLHRQVLDRLAETYPTPRQRADVPVWLYVASEISLKLHGAAAYHTYPLILRSGGLINALGPKVGRKAVHPETGDVSLACAGFNHKHTFDRQTPCDQDFLRKFARDTDVDRLHRWFNREVPRCLRSLKLFDPEGLFIGDGSYLFVPDNENYQQADKLLFDDHNHPVDPQKVDLSDHRYRWRRCYKLVSLIHIHRSLDLFLTVAARVTGGRQHECPILYELVDEFVQAVDRGWRKVLILDRGFLDGARIGRLKTDYGIDTVIPLKTNMDAYHDAIGLTRLKDFGWESYEPPVARLRGQKDRPKPPVLVRREQKRQQTLAARKGLPAPPPLAYSQTLLGTARGLTSWTDCPVPLTATVNREIHSDGRVDDWVLVTTAPRWSAQQTRATYALRTAIEERHRQYKCFWDIPRMHSRRFSLVVNQVLFVLLAYTLMQAHLFLRQRQALNRNTRARALGVLGPTVEVIAVYSQQRFCLLRLTEFAELLLELEEAARGKLLKKMRELKRDLYALLKNPRPP